MAGNLKRFVEHLRAEGYHPRSNKHSNALADVIVADLLETCPQLHPMAASGRLVYELNFTITTGTSEWNCDLVLGQAPPNVQPPTEGSLIRRARPSTIQMAVEIKSIMTEHRKAVKNRKRDLEAHHDHVHRYNAAAIAAGVFVVNQAGTFKSPLRTEVTRHKNVKALVSHCLLQARSLNRRTGPEGQGLDAAAVIVVEMDNLDLQGTRLVSAAPAPAVGDPLHYDAFIQSLCSRYRARFLG